MNKDNRDPQYVESIVKRSQKIVDKLGLTDVKVAEDVRNVIANRYFELNDIYEVRDAKVKKIKESGLSGAAKDDALKAVEYERMRHYTVLTLHIPRIYLFFWMRSK